MNWFDVVKLDYGCLDAHDIFNTRLNSNRALYLELTKNVPELWRFVSRPKGSNFCTQLKEKLEGFREHGLSHLNLSVGSQSDFMEIVEEALEQWDETNREPKGRMSWGAGPTQDWKNQQGRKNP